MMTEETEPTASTASAAASTDASQTRQRKKRKWDQPADSLISAGVAVPGVLPVGNMGFLGGVSFPGISPAPGAILMNPLSASSVSKPQLKIQDELIIAREIVINDAESSVRYKLTKRQTQEEIQKCTGAVVITRGKYHPPNSPPDSEKPLYLHISAGAHLKEIAEQIIAVDRAASMVEEMLKSQSIQVSQGLSTCVLLGFDADPLLNIASRIRGPNDQYINHIMNETGATVLLRGLGSGNFESARGDGQQPLHLFLSSSNPKSLEDAKRLAENLLDTISVECGASRVSSAKVYGAVPPVQQLAGAQMNGNATKANTGSSIVLTPLTHSPAPSVAVPTVFSHVTVPQLGALPNCPHPQQSMVAYPLPPLTGGTSYSGYYGGIYPQATPLQQVALALRQSSSPTISTVAPTTPVALAEPKLSENSNADKEKRSQQRRKFQELPLGSKTLTNLHQGVEVPKSSKHTDFEVRNVSTLPAPKKLVQLPLNGMPMAPPRATPPPPPAKAMPPPPPPPKFNSSVTEKEHDKSNIRNKSISETVPETLFKLMEYGDDDDDDEDDAEETSEESLGRNSNTVTTTQKPFWAV